MPDDATITHPPPEEPHDILHTGEAGGRVVRGGVVRAAGFGVGILFGLATSAVLLRHLGVETYGMYGTVATLLGLVLALSDGGLTATGSRAMSLAPVGPERDRTTATLMAIRLITTLLGVGLAVGFAAVTYEREMTIGAALVGASIVIISMQSMATLPMLVTLRLVPVTIVEVLRHVLTFAGIVVLVLAGAGLTWFYALQIPIAAIMLVVTLAYVSRFAKIGMRFDRAEIVRLLRETLPLAVASTMIVLYGGAMVIIVSLVADAYQTGLFVTSARVMEVVVGLPGIVVALALPVLSVASAHDRERLRSAVQLMIELGLVISTAVAVTLAFAAPFVIAVIGGSAFAEAAPILQVQAFAIVGVFVSQTLQYALIGLQQQRSLMITNSIALGAVLILGITLVSAFDAIGGAYAVLGAESLLIVLLVIALHRVDQSVVPSFRFGWRIIACIIVAALAALIPGIPAWLCAAIALGLFLATAAVVRAVPAELVVALGAPIWGKPRVRALLRRYYGAA